MTLEQTCETLRRLTGRVEFIKYISSSSYNKLEKMIRIKCGSTVKLKDMKIQRKKAIKKILQLSNIEK